MAPFQIKPCWEAQLERMLDDQKPEDAHLDYKGTESLLPPGRGGGGLDRQKRAEDISKDVSSFLNSDGGVLVYGVPESDEPRRTGGSPIPGGRGIGFRKGEVTKETIEDLITSNIQPRPGPDLFQVTEVPYCGRIVFVVEVDVGLDDVWQAKDRRYYKRFNYKAEPMDHFEVEMVRNRTIGPNLKLAFGLNDQWDSTLSNAEYLARRGEEVRIHVGIQNTRNCMVEAALIELGLYHPHDMDANAKIVQGEAPKGIFPVEFEPVVIRKITCDNEGEWGFLNGVTVALGQLSWNGANPGLAGRYSPVFKTETPVPVTALNMRGVTMVNGIASLHAACFWRIQAPNMKTTTGIVGLQTGNRTSTITHPYIVTNEDQWDIT